MKCWCGAPMRNLICSVSHVCFHGTPAGTRCEFCERVRLLIAPQTLRMESRYDRLRNSRRFFEAQRRGMEGS
jgi:hypothetical protein